MALQHASIRRKKDRPDNPNKIEYKTLDLTQLREVLGEYRDANSHAIFDVYIDPNTDVPCFTLLTPIEIAHLVSNEILEGAVSRVALAAKLGSPVPIGLG